MFKRHDVTLINNPVCEKAVSNLDTEDFKYYDKDGFELNRAEQKFYDAMGYPINYPILNHTCWQEPWFELNDSVENLSIDHCMFLCRCEYSGAALNQLESLKNKNPLASFLIKTKTKWGFDFALDGIRDGEVFEVIHIEYDNNNYDKFSSQFLNFDYLIRHTDWQDAADKVWAKRDEWKCLKGFDQNHWKANYLIGWDRSEILEKSI